MKKLFKSLFRFIDILTLKLILILTYFTLPFLLGYTLYYFYFFVISKVLIGLFTTMCFVKINQRIQGGKH